MDSKQQLHFRKDLILLFFIAAASMLVSSEKKGLTLKAPDYGIDKLYYDGHRVEVMFKLLSVALV